MTLQENERRQVEQLEKIMDEETLANFLTVTVIICREKADHIRFSWQDEELAKYWDRMANRIETQAQTALDYGI